MNMFKAVVAVAGLGLASTAFGDAVLNGTIYHLGGTAVGTPSEDSLGGVISSIDKIYFTVNTAGQIDMDLLSWEFDHANGVLADVNGDGEIAFFDTYIYLFNNDGSLDAADYIISNDDWGNAADGSVYIYDSFLSLNLGAGNYILTVGGFNHDVNDAIAGVNPGTGGGYYPITSDANAAFTVNDHGDYRVTFTGDVTVVPVPSAAALLGLGGLVAARRRR